LIGGDRKHAGDQGGTFMCWFRRGDGRFLGLRRVDNLTGRLSLIDCCGSTRT